MDVAATAPRFCWSYTDESASSEDTYLRHRRRKEEQWEKKKQKKAKQRERDGERVRMRQECEGGRLEQQEVQTLEM